MATRMRRVVTGLLGGMLACAGCGAFTARPTELANPETGENGEPLLLDDIEAIATDMDLTDQEKREALQDLGIEDEDLLDAFLTTP